MEKVLISGFITANFINNGAAVQEETEFLKQKYAQAVNASVARWFCLL